MLIILIIYFVYICIIFYFKFIIDYWFIFIIDDGSVGLIMGICFINEIVVLFNWVVWFVIFWEIKEEELDGVDKIF